MDDSQKLLDYCCILLHDHMKFDMGRVSNTVLIEFFIRNSLKVASTSKVKEYFENHVVHKSAIGEIKSNTIRDWIDFHNRLCKTRVGYNNLIPMSTKERRNIKDIRHIKYRILAYEVSNNVNGVQPFNIFFKKRLVTHTPNHPTDCPNEEIKLDVDEEETNQNIAFNKTPFSNPKIRQNYATIKSKKSSSSSACEDEDIITETAYGICDDIGLNNLIVEIQNHSQSSCSGTLRHSIGNSFFKPSLRLECSAQSKYCTVGRMKSINLTCTSSFPYGKVEHQCSAAAARLTGGLLINGQNAHQIKKAFRQSGLKVSNVKFNAVAGAYMNQVYKEYNEQQKKINTIYRSKKGVCVATDTSYSQGRNARYSQTAMLEQKSGEIIQMVILDKEQEKCSSNNLDVLGVERVIDRCHDAQIPLAGISTDECSAV